MKYLYVLLTVSLTVVSCKESNTKNTTQLALNNIEIEHSQTPIAKEFKKYWYNGTAEITSYKLEQARYGEFRSGEAVHVFVTEPFLPKEQVKADHKEPSNIPVLKLNTTKKYLTGIYPYSIMTSSFYPVYDNTHAEKVSFSSQEWCGHVYAQLNNRGNFNITSHSYFASEGDQKLALEQNPLEDEIWNKIRINPENLVMGETYMIPSLEFIRLKHKELKAYKTITSSITNKDKNTYTVYYPALERTLKITYKNKFPYSIEKWTDSFRNGSGYNSKILTTTATKITTIKTPYWSKNHNKDLYLRDSLGLK